MLDALRRVLEADDRIAYALLFGSARDGSVRPGGDVDVALAFFARPAALVVGEIASRLEAATGRSVDLVLLDEATPAVAYRAFRDGVVLACRDRAAFVDRKARAILEYLDYRPVEERLARGVLDAAAHGR